MKREALRVEPISTFLDRRNAPVSPVTRAGNMVFVSGLPPFDPETGQIGGMAIERQSELVMEQMKLCLAAAGASLDNVMKCNVYCTSTQHFAAFNAVYVRYFPVDPPARIFVCTPEWFAPSTSRSTASRWREAEAIADRQHCAARHRASSERMTRAG